MSGGDYLEFTSDSSFTVNFGLWTKLPNAAGAIQLASGSVMTTVGNNWVDAFWTPVAATIGTQYFLTFSSSSNGVAGDTNNPYAGGNVLANSGYESFDGYDYAFRTFASDGVGGVPEPTTWALTIAGFAMIGAAARRRRTYVTA